VAITARLTTACTRPESGWMSFARLDAPAVVCGRVMPGVRFSQFGSNNGLLMTKRRVILLALAAWLVGCGGYFYWFVTSIMALPDLASYEQSAGWPVMVFLIFRLPPLLTGLLLLIWLEALLFELLPKRGESSCEL
jgi:hypothetical protein